MTAITNLNYLTFNNLDNAWREFLLKQSSLLSQIDDKLCQIAGSNTIYPKAEHIFRALELTKPQDVKVVIIGQDPYHGYNQANGLAFSVNRGVALPPSLLNIFKELTNEYELSNINNLQGDLLENWAKQGVLLLNSTLAVIESRPNSLQSLGFELITDSIIKYLSQTEENIVFILWGAFAIKKSVFIDSSRHCILTSVHPSPLSAHRGFFGCNHFRLCNDYLSQHQREPIDWLNYIAPQSSLF